MARYPTENGISPRFVFTFTDRGEKEEFDKENHKIYSVSRENSLNFIDWEITNCIDVQDRKSTLFYIECFLDEKKAVICHAITKADECINLSKVIFKLEKSP